MESATKTCIIYGHQITLRNLIEGRGIRFEGPLKHVRDSDFMNAMKWCCHTHNFDPGQNVVELLNKHNSLQDLKVGNHTFRRFRLDEAISEMYECTHLGIVWGEPHPDWEPSFFYKSMFQAPFILFLYDGEVVKPFRNERDAKMFFQLFLELEELGRKEFKMPEPEEFTYYHDLESLLQKLTKGGNRG